MTLDLRLTIGGSRLLEAARLQQAANRMGMVEQQRRRAVEAQGKRLLQAQQQQAGASGATEKALTMLPPVSMVQGTLATKRAAATRLYESGEVFWVLDILGPNGPRMIRRPDGLVAELDPAYTYTAVETNTGPSGGPAVLFQNTAMDFASDPSATLFYSRLPLPSGTPIREYCAEGFELWPAITTFDTVFSLTPVTVALYYNGSDQPGDTVDLGFGAADQTMNPVRWSGSALDEGPEAYPDPSYSFEDRVKPYGSGYFHYAICYYNSTVYWYVNGQLIAALPMLSDGFDRFGVALSFQSSSTFEPDRRIGGFRFTPGNARYRSNFTPPTAPFPLQ